MPSGSRNSFGLSGGFWRANRERRHHRTSREEPSLPKTSYTNRLLRLTMFCRTRRAAQEPMLRSDVHEPGPAGEAADGASSLPGLKPEQVDSTPNLPDQPPSSGAGWQPAHHAADQPRLRNVGGRRHAAAGDAVHAKHSEHALGAYHASRSADACNRGQRSVARLHQRPRAPAIRCRRPSRPHKPQPPPPPPTSLPLLLPPPLRHPPRPVAPFPATRRRPLRQRHRALRGR